MQCTAVFVLCQVFSKYFIVSSIVGPFLGSTFINSSFFNENILGSSFDCHFSLNYYLLAHREDIVKSPINH